LLQRDSEDYNRLRKQRIDPLAIRQLIGAALILAFFLGLAGHATWKDKTWLRSTATVVASEELCQYYYVHSGLAWTLAGRGNLIGVTVPCSDVARNLELRQAWNVDRDRFFFHGYMDPYWSTKVSFKDSKGNEQQQTVFITASQVTKPALSIKNLSKDRRAVGLWSGLVAPGDRYEIAYSSHIDGRVDLAANLPWDRKVWTWVFIVVTVMFCFVFALQMLPSSKEEHERWMQDRADDLFDPF
jgi:hypothetical protein